MEENGLRNYFKIKSPLKYGTRPRSKYQPLYLQSDMHLQSDTLSSALHGPLKILSPETNVSSGVSKANIIYIRQKHFLFPATLSIFIFWASFLEMFWDIQYSYFRIFKELFFFNFFMQLFL